MNQNDTKYRVLAEHYDVLDKDPHLTDSNALLDRILRDYHVSRVLDVSCGTGHQVEFLHQLGYLVTGMDICEEMLEIAQRKNPAIDYRIGDMRCTRCGQFDAVISSANSVGLLSRDDLARALTNVHAQLNAGGILLFEILNPDPVVHLAMAVAREQGLDATVNAIGKSPPPAGTIMMDHEVIDRAVETEGKKYVRFRRMGFDPQELVVAFQDRILIQEAPLKPPAELQDNWTLQLYTADALKSLLATAGFELDRLTDGEDQPFEESTSRWMHVVARKR